MTNTERWQWLVVVLLLGGLLYLLSPVLTPFALSALLAYLGDPLVDRLERLRLSRSLSVAIVFAFWLVLIVGVLLLLVPFMERQVANLIVQLPRWIDWAQNTAAPWQRLGKVFRELEPRDLYEVEIVKPAASGDAALGVETRPIVIRKERRVAQVKKRFGRGTLLRDVLKLCRGEHELGPGVVAAVRNVGKTPALLEVRAFFLRQGRAGARHQQRQSGPATHGSVSNS